MKPRKYPPQLPTDICPDCGESDWERNTHTGSRYCKGCLPRECRTCREIKPSAEFYHKDKKKGRRSSQCKRCQINDQREKVLGITEEEYQMLHSEQDGHCAICGTTMDDFQHDRFAVDHCHDSLQIRGLLCPNCNTGIGLFKDSPERLKAAILYLAAPRTHQIYAHPPKESK